ncbi:MAG: TraR/DksA C4-type zinc finger protein [Saprospiraceae bacterium]|nr:TraR/DksA C4-type zinc finger protein [Saprospiraceae bacterium]
MTSDEKQLLQGKIERKIRLTREKIAQMEEMTQPVTPENAIGRISRMDAINNKSVMEAALRTARRELEGLEYAQNHLDDPDFGLCHRCRTPIQVARLMVMPGTRHCARCAR